MASPCGVTGPRGLSVRSLPRGVTFRAVSLPRGVTFRAACGTGQCGMWYRAVRHVVPGLVWYRA